MKTFEENGRVMVIVERGELLVESLTKHCLVNNLHGGFITGLGALTDVQLGFYHLHRKNYERKTFSKEYELLSLNGNIALKDEAPFIHVHAVLGDEDFSAFGGHLFEARVAVTAEVSIAPFDFAPVRKLNSEIGLALVCDAVPSITR